MKAGIEERPSGRLQSMFGKEQPAPYAVPLNRDAYQIALDHIDPDPRQPRKTFDDAELQHLAQTIRESGLLQPIVVYRTEDPTRYRIIAGERRYRAAKLAGLSAVPCLEMPADFDTALAIYNAKVGVSSDTLRNYKVGISTRTRPDLAPAIDISSIRFEGSGKDTVLTLE